MASLSPDCYCFQNSPRENDRLGGGVMYKSIIGIKLTHANQCRSFEFSEWNVTIQNHVIKPVACIVHRHLVLILNPCFLRNFLPTSKVL